MIQYAALHHVRIGRHTYTPGEIIDVTIPDDKRTHLLSRGAIRIAGAPLAFSGQEETQQGTEDEKAQASPVDPPVIKSQEVSRTPDDDDDGQPDDEDAEEGMEEPGDDEEGDDDQGDAPVIDVMDGIIPSEGTDEQTSEQPDKKTRTAGRRK